MFLDSNRTVFRFFSWLDLLVQAFWIPIQKIFKSLHNYLHSVTDITGVEKHFVCFTLYGDHFIWIIRCWIFKEEIIFELLIWEFSFIKNLNDNFIVQLVEKGGGMH